MNWDDYEGIWRRQELPTGAGADLTLIRATFESKRRKFKATLLVRDITEGLLGVLAALGLLGYAWSIGKTGWPIAVGALLILGVALVFVRDFLRRRRLRLGPQVPLLVKLDAEISELHHQRRLLSHIGIWYFLPYLAALVLIYTTVFRRLGIKLPSELLIALLTTPRSAVFIYLIVAVVVASLWLVWRDARDAGKTRIDPRIRELEKMRRDLFGVADNPGD
ncbi:MAG: hypothetical protein JWM32_3053 [Verrucomicrobia bacterium]|nr:hypothetical protein [Verrucomicrobiota bacterium]